MDGLQSDYNPDQLFLPAWMGDLIKDDSAVWLIMDIVDSKMVAPLTEKLSLEGRPAYPPLLMVRLLVLAYYYGIKSSREIMWMTQTHLEFMFICGRKTPDFRTISRFRKEKEDFLKSLYKEVYRMAMELGVAKLGTIAIDSTIMKGNVSGAKNVSELSVWREKEKELTRIIEEYHRICEENDAGGEELGGLPDELQDTKKRREKIRALIEKSDVDGVSEDTRLGLADPDARFIKKSKSKKHVMGFNVGVLVDENQFFIHGEMTNEGDDHALLERCIAGAEQTIGGEFEEGTKILADNGFSSIDNLKLLEEKKLDGYVSQTGEFKQLRKGADKVPQPPDSGEVAKEGERKSIEMAYDCDEDCFHCSGGNVLTRVDKTYECSDARREVKFKSKNPCTACPYALEGLCKLSGRSHKYLSRTVGFEKLEAMKRKLSSDDGREIYKKRRFTVEPPIGNVKHNMGLDCFGVRGFAGFVEFGLTAMVHNLKKLASLLKKKAMESGVILRNCNIGGYILHATG